MSSMSGNVFRALKAANVPDDLAQKAAEDVASHGTELSDIKGDLKLLKWICTLNTAILTGLALKAFF